MFNLIKKLFKNKKEKISIITDEENNVSIVFNGNKKINRHPVSIEVEACLPNLSSISNLFTTNQIEGGVTFTSFALLSTERFKDSIDDYELMGDYYISMSNGNFDYAYIFNTGSDQRIPATGLGLDSETFTFLEKLINENREITLTTDNNLNKVSQYLNPYLYYINESEKAGTKICGCQNKKRK